MRLLTACALTASMLAASAGAQIVAPPDPGAAPGNEECAIALAAVSDRGPPRDFNIWPMLRAEPGDERWPLDCSVMFNSLGLGRPDEFARESLSISRPAFMGEDAATVLIDASRGLQSHTRTRYTLARGETGWRVIARTDVPMDGAMEKLA